MPRRFFHRHQPAQDAWSWLKIGIGGALGIGIVAFLGDVSDSALLIAPFGATAVLLFGVPDSPMAQPANVIGGHFLASLLALALKSVLPPEWWAIALTVGVAMFAMALMRLTHPPAGADPIVIFLSDPTWMFLWTPILAGSVLLVALATLVHRLPPRTEYPIAPKNTGGEGQLYVLETLGKPDREARAVFDEAS